MPIYLKLDDVTSVPTAHAAGIKKVLSTGNKDLTRLTQIAYGTLEAGEEIPAHNHPDMEETYFFTKGAGQMTIDEQVFDLAEGVFLIVPAGAKHFLKCTGERLEFYYFGLQVY